MFKIRRKSLSGTVVRSKLVFGMLLFLTVFAVRTVYERYTIERDMVDRRLEVEAELLSLEERRAQLEEDVTYLQHERGIEAEMRRQFDVVREGEQVVIILDEEEEEPESGVLGASTSTPVEVVEPWYKIW